MLFYLRSCRYTVHEFARQFLRRYGGAGQATYPKYNYFLKREWSWVINPLKANLTDWTSWPDRIQDASQRMDACLCPVGAICVSNGFIEGCYAIIVIDGNGSLFQITEDDDLLPLVADTNSSGKLSIAPEDGNILELMGDETSPNTTKRRLPWHQLVPRVLNGFSRTIDGWRGFLLIVTVIGGVFTLLHSLPSR